LVGLNYTKYSLISTLTLNLSISVTLQEKLTSQQVLVTHVYGPITAELKQLFGDELTSLYSSWNPSLIVGGDFNSIFNRQERRGVSFDYRNS